MAKRLIVRWDKRQRDFVIHYPRKCDGHLANNRIFSEWVTTGGTAETWLECKFEPSFADELKARGYDMTTLRFEIKLKMESPAAAGKEN